MRRLIGPAAVLVTALLTFHCRTPGAAEAHWYKGNTHTHTLWSDGDGAPELVTDWYRERGYDFLVLSDHNLLSEGERWFPITAEGRLRPAHVEELRARFGPERVRVREGEQGPEMRLATLAELRADFERPGDFRFLQGEEITDAFEKRPVHVNGVNLAERIAPQGGASLRETLQRNVQAVIEQGRRLGRPVLAHVNHPNFGWGLGWEDLAELRGERFFEVYNGHSAVRNQGDAEHPSTERMWDLANAHRLGELGLEPLLGVATDDSHQYHEWGVGRTNPGRGWVVVRAGELTPAALVEALRRGDFYASSGVELEDIASDGASLSVRIAAEPDLEYTTRFVGTRRGGAAGETLAETRANPAVYAFAGDELYVRATVTSSRLHPNPYAEGDREQAWVQPVVPSR